MDTNQIRSIPVCVSYGEPGEKTDVLWVYHPADLRWHLPCVEAVWGASEESILHQIVGLVRMLTLLEISADAIRKFGEGEEVLYFVVIDIFEFVTSGRLSKKPSAEFMEQNDRDLIQYTSSLVHQKLLEKYHYGMIEAAKSA